MEVKRIASQVREVAISVALVILIPLLLRYGVRLFFTIDFRVVPLIGLGFVVLASCVKDCALSFMFLLVGLYFSLFESYSFFSYAPLEYHNELVRFLVYVAILIVLSINVWCWERLKRQAV